jgi:DNA polymerase-3 subunit delta'
MHKFFLGIQGQKSALNILSELHTQKRVPHALLFKGIEGCGKFYTAVQFLKILNADSQIAVNKINQLAEPYVKLIFPLPRGKGETNSDDPISKLTQDVIDEISSQIKLKSEDPYHKIDIKNANNIKINSIREINKIISFNYDEISYRGIIINDAHKMSIEAQNAFLKNLEEPPEGIIYFILTENPDELLTTIKSRCWEINFTPLKNDDLVNILNAQYKVNKNEINDIIQFSQGSVTNTLFLIQNNFEDYLRRTIVILRYSLAKKYFTALKEFNEIIAENSIFAYQIILDLIIFWLNDTLKQKLGISNISFSNYIETLEKFNERFTKANINQITINLIELRNAPNRNVSLNLLAVNVIFEIASIGQNSK